jgi:hypothetical protein
MSEVDHSAATQNLPIYHGLQTQRYTYKGQALQ